MELPKGWWVALWVLVRLFIQLNNNISFRIGIHTLHETSIASDQHRKYRNRLSAHTIGFIVGFWFGESSCYLYYYDHKHSPLGSDWWCCSWCWCGRWWYRDFGDSLLIFIRLYGCVWWSFGVKTPSRTADHRNINNSNRAMILTTANTDDNFCRERVVILNMMRFPFQLRLRRDFNFKCHYKYSLRQWIYR